MVADRPQGRRAGRRAGGGPKFLRDLVSLATGQFASMGIGFLAFAWLARQLDPAAYGTLEFAIALTAFAAIVIECGAGSIGTREVARDPALAGRIAADMVLARGLVALAVVPAVAAGALLAGPVPGAQALVILYALSLLAVPLKQDWLLQARERMTLAALVVPVRTVVFAGGVVLLVGGGEDLALAGAIEIAAAGAASLYLLVAQRRLGIGFDWRAELSGPLRLIREGMAVGLSNMLWAFMLYTPVLLLAALADGMETAWFGAAARLAVSLMTLSFLYHFSLYPVIVRTLAEDRAAWARVTEASSRLVAWTGTGLALGTSLASGPLMAFLFGPPFAAAGPALAVLVWMFPLRTFTGHARWSLVAGGAQRWLLVGEVAGAAALLAAGFAAIPAFGAAGAALALLVGLGTSGIVTHLAAERTAGPLGLARTALPPLAAALAAAGAARLLAADPLAQTGLALLFFAAAALLQGRTLAADLLRIAYAKAGS